MAKVIIARCILIVFLGIVVKLAGFSVSDAPIFEAVVVNLLAMIAATVTIPFPPSHPER